MWECKNFIPSATSYNANTRSPKRRIDSVEYPDVSKANVDRCLEAVVVPFVVIGASVVTLLKADKCKDGKDDDNLEGADC